MSNILWAGWTELGSALLTELEMERRVLVLVLTRVISLISLISSTTDYRSR